MRYVVQVKFEYEVESDETIAEVTNRMNKRVIADYKPTKIMIFVDEYEFAMKRREIQQLNNASNHTHNPGDEDCCPEEF